MNRDGQLRKLTLNADGMLSGTVYGDLHPSGRFGVFSTNIVLPGMHTVATKRMEVYDTASDLTVADFDRNVMVNVPHVARADAFETFPCCRKFERALPTFPLPIRKIFIFEVYIP